MLAPIKMKTTTIIFGLFLYLFGFSQSNSQMISYYNNISISDRNGVAIDSTVYFFPIDKFTQKHEWFIFKDPYTNEIKKKLSSKSLKTVYESEWSKYKIKDSVNFSSPDTSMDQWFSFDLYKLQEPILYNFYLCKDIYRFTWLRSFQPPVTIRIEIYNNTAKIYTKRLERSIGHIMLKSLGNNKYDTIYPNNNIPLVIDLVKEISLSEVDRIEHIIDSTKLYNSDLFEEIYGLDGSEWIFETHTKAGYFYANRFTPSNEESVYIIGMYFISLSGLEDEDKY
jgi:hypothetical protein